MTNGTRLPLLALALAALPATAFQEDPARAVREAAAALKDESTRAGALDRLMHLPRAALEELDRCEIAPDARKAVLQEVELHERIRESYGPPRRFTFDGKEDTFGNYLVALEAATGFTFQKHAVDLSARVTLAVQDAPFWETFHELCRKAEVTSYPPMGDHIYLQPGGRPKPASGHGPLVVLMDRVSEHRKTDFDRLIREMDVHLVCLWERHVTPIGVTRKYRLLRADDATGRSLLPDGPPVPDAAPSPVPGLTVRPQAESIDLRHLKPLPAGSRRLARLEGTFEMEFPDRVEIVPFASPLDAPGGTKAVDGVRVELRYCTVAGNSLIAEFSLRFDDEKEAHAFRPFPRDVVLPKPASGPEPTVNVYNFRREKGGAVFSVRAYNMADPRAVKEISVRVPRGRVVKNVPFSFRDVEIQ